MKKRSLSLFLALIMLVTAIPFAAAGDGDVPKLETDEEGYYLVDDYVNFRNHLNANRQNKETLHYRLKTDITMEDKQGALDLQIVFMKVELDLKGHTIRRDTHSVD